ncbi:MAG TPA: energy transducer TonB [Longimicrobium sp.]|nr:energy transducer TonB [Longimicrobium sp.]
MRLRPAALLLLCAACAACASAPPPAADPGAPAEREVAYDVTQVDVVPRATNPRVLSNAIARRFPRHLRGSGVSGEVVVRFRVDTRGVPQEVHVLRSSHVEFEQPAVEAVRLLRFRPGMRGGRRVHVWMTREIEWSIPRT